MTQIDKAVAARRPAANRWNATDLGLIAVFAALVAGSALIAAVPGGRTGSPHHPADARGDAHRTGPRPRPGVRRRRSLRAPGTRRAADLQRRTQRARRPGRPLGGLHHWLPPRRDGGGLADRRRAPPHGGPSRQAPRGPAFAAAMVSSIIFVHGLGILGMMVNAKLDLAKAFLADLVLLPGRCDQERPGRDHRAGPAQGIPGPADPPDPDRGRTGRPAATAPRWITGREHHRWTGWRCGWRSTAAPHRRPCSLSCRWSSPSSGSASSAPTAPASPPCSGCSTDSWRPAAATVTVDG